MQSDFTADRFVFALTSLGQEDAMYDFVDRPVTQLDNGGRILVWSMRNWVSAVQARKCPAQLIAPAFSAGNLLPGLPHFLRMMALFNRHGLENLEFSTVGCCHISEHEAVLLALLCTARKDPQKTVRKTLELLVKEEAVKDLHITLVHLAATMASAGVDIGLPGAEADAPAPDSGSARP